MRKLALAALLVAALGAAWFAYDADAACCYFAAQEKDINQPGQKAFITWVPEEKLESFTVQPKFEGNAVDFGMVIPTPSQPKLDEMPRDFFKDLAIYTILMPVPQPIWLMPPPMKLQQRGGSDDKTKGHALGEKNHGVKVLEAGVVGSLDYKIITAETPDGLYAWLKENGYIYSGDEATLGFYIEKKWFFTVMKIDPQQMKKNADGSYTGEVTPTRFTFTSEQCIYPLKITQISVKDKTDALLYVQAPQQMDLQGDLSWKHSFRVMWLTYMLGCGANEQQQQELAARQQWVNDKKAKDPAYETTKLEWARKLAEADLSVLEDPLAHYAQMGGGDLPAGSQVIPIDQFLKEAAEELGKQEGEYAKERLEELRTQYTADKGQVVKVSTPGGRFMSSPYMWYANREAPAEDVKGLSRLKGHLRQGQWITKIRKVLRKDEMTDDLLLVPVDPASEQEYVRLMPTSPP
ncbi:MAG: DUF2330 domain-containing protein [Planctomycetota bacterium]